MQALRMAVCALVSACAVMLAAPGGASGAYDYYLKVEGVPGDSADVRHKNEILIESFSWGLTGPGAKKEPAKAQDVNVVKHVDRASPVLLELVASGQTVPTAILTARKAGREQQEASRYCFTGVRFTNLSSGGAQGSDALMESVSFNYATIVHRYPQYRDDGSEAPPVWGGWDFVNNLRFGRSPGC